MKSLLKHRVVMPVVRLLRAGATPEKLAWSLAVGSMVGVNPLLGSTTLLALALAGVFRLNLAASQLTSHLVYPVELMLFPLWVALGARLFGTAGLSLEPKVLFAATKAHPWAMTLALWRWEWHALVVWAAASFVVTPVLARCLTPVLRHALERLHRHERTVQPQ